VLSGSFEVSLVEPAAVVVEELRVSAEALLPDDAFWESDEAPELESELGLHPTANNSAANAQYGEKDFMTPLGLEKFFHFRRRRYGVFCGRVSGRFR
jgi:hypothetical protein